MRNFKPVENLLIRSQEILAICTKQRISISCSLNLILLDQLLLWRQHSYRIFPWKFLDFLMRLWTFFFIPPILGWRTFYIKTHVKFQFKYLQNYANIDGPGVFALMVEASLAWKFELLVYDWIWSWSAFEDRSNVLIIRLSAFKASSLEIS